MRTLSLVGLMVLLLCPSALRAQFVYGTTGLLHMPTGEMQRDKTFMFGCAFLDTEARHRGIGVMIRVIILLI